MAYAPPPRSGYSQLLVIVGGALTTILAFSAVHIIAAIKGIDLLGFYVLYFIPAGALLVGLAAGLGYGVASFYTGARIRGWVALLIFFSQVGAWFLDKYVSFCLLGPLITRQGVPVSFGMYLDAVVNSMTWVRDWGSHEAVGEIALMFWILQIAGFAVGSMLTSAFTTGLPYCDLCRYYLRQRKLVTVPAGVSSKELLAGGRDLQAAHDRRFVETRNLAAKLFALATAGDSTAFVETLTPYVDGTKAASKFPRRVTLCFVRCPRCREGNLKVLLLEGTGSQPLQTTLHKGPVAREFIAAVEARLDVPL